MMPEQQMERLNKRALFADETLDYRIPEEPDASGSAQEKIILIMCITLRMREK